MPMIGTAIIETRNMRDDILNLDCIGLKFRYLGILENLIFQPEPSL